MLSVGASELGTDRCDDLRSSAGIRVAAAKTRAQDGVFFSVRLSRILGMRFCGDLSFFFKVGVSLSAIPRGVLYNKWIVRMHMLLGMLV